jgi:hypothetical protein
MFLCLKYFSPRFLIFVILTKEGSSQVTLQRFELRCRVSFGDSSSLGMTKLTQNLRQTNSFNLMLIKLQINQIILDRLWIPVLMNR